MRSFQKAVTSTAVSLETLTGDTKFSTYILLQAPETNTANIYFGEKGREVAFIVPGGSAGLNTTLANVFVKGTAPDELIVVTL